VKVGVLALQGAFREHREVLDALGVASLEVRGPAELAAVDALVVPGGESTTMSKLLDTSQLRAPLVDALSHDLPVLGTCAGMIALATEVVDGRADQESLGVIDISVRRNGYGRQADSFEAPLRIDGLPGGAFPGVFIRAPVVERVGDSVEVLAEHEGIAVLVRQGAAWASSFHPELSGDLRLHERFIAQVA
jgi:5'-phosphate synthase pdxT subunit